MSGLKIYLAREAENHTLVDTQRGANPMPLRRGYAENAKRSKGHFRARPDGSQVAEKALCSPKLNL